MNKKGLGKAFEAYLVTFMSTCTKSEDYIWYADMGPLTGKPEFYRWFDKNYNRLPKVIFGI